MANSNCLENLVCPECGHEESFKIRALATFDVIDDGTNDYEEVDWDSSSFCQCGNPECEHRGTVAEFTQMVALVDGDEEATSLQQMVCPDCGKPGPFDIRGRAWFRALPDGRVIVQQTDGFRFNDDDMCNCVICAEKGIGKNYSVTDFKEAWKNAQSRNEQT